MAGGAGVQLASGEKGGTYSDVYARKLVAALSGWDVSVRNTKGSAENLDLLADGKVDLAFAQADVYAQRMDEEPEHFGKLRALGAFAEECVYVARRAAGGPKTLRDLGVAGAGDEYPTISLGAYGGGMSDSWNHIVTLIPALAQAEVDHTASTAALEKLAAGKVDAAAWITDPRNHAHKMLVALRGNDSIELMSIDDPALADQLPDGRQVYRVKKVKTSAGASAPDLTTVCTEAMIFAGPGADPKLVEDVTRVVPGLRR
jgi:TRAP-type uncharacterized transport system substrate-binding protein